MLNARGSQFKAFVGHWNLYGSSCSQVFCKIDFEKEIMQYSQDEMLSCEHCKNFKKSFFYFRTPPVAACVCYR